MRDPTVHRVSLLAEVHYCKAPEPIRYSTRYTDLADDGVNARLLRYLPGKADGFL